MEDSANPDSTPFVVNADGVVVSGGTTPVSDVFGVSRLQIQTTDGNALSLQRYSANAFSPLLYFAKSRGSVGSQGIVSSGDTVGVLTWTASDGTGFIRASEIVSQIDGTPGTNDMPGRLVFSTTADGASSPTERMRISNAGNIGINEGGSAAGQLTIGGTLVSASNITRGVFVRGAAPSTSTSEVSAFYSNPSTQAASFTVSTLSHYVAVQGTVGAGSTITNQIGFNANSTLIGATNNFGFYSNIASGTGRWNFYANGTANNYFGGNVGIGTSSPNQILSLSSSNTTGTAINIVNTSSGGYDWNIFSGGSAGSLAPVGSLVFRDSTNGVTRVFINTTGALKARSGGAVSWSSTGEYHESSAAASNVPCHLFYSTNASLVNEHTSFITARSANSAFQCAAFYTSGAADLEFNLRGDGNGYADGTWNNNGADYAEFFESATGQAIPVGSTVVLENNKVRLATASDNPSDVIGVVRPKEPSKASMVVGNTAWNKWANKYLTDDFDRYIMEDHDVLEWADTDGKQYSYESHNIPADVVVPANVVRKTHDEKGNKFQHYKLNPAWDKDVEYVNRENREEWLIIGLVGQVKVLKGQVMGERWRKMRDVSANVQEWFIR